MNDFGKAIVLDLRSTRELPQVRYAGIFRWIVGIGLASGLVGLLVVGVKIALSGQLLDRGVVLLGLFGFITVVIGIIFVGAAPQPDSIKLDSRGIWFRYPNGRIRTLNWGSPGFHLLLESTPGVPDGESRGRTMYVLLGNRPFHTYLTPEAYHGILSNARAVGIPVVVGPSSRPGWTRVVIGKPAS